MQVEIILLGDSGVGKTSLLTKLNKGIFEHDMPSSIGLDYFSLKMNKWGQDIIVKFWDTAGQQKFASVTSTYIKKADGVAVVASAEHSLLENLQQFQKHLKIFEKQNESKNVILIVNKSDLKKVQDKEAIVYSKRKIEDLKQRYHNASIHFVSAKTDSKEEIYRVFLTLIKNILNVSKGMSDSFLETIVFTKHESKCMNCSCFG